ncbi:MAG: hypothetical protein C0514_05895 [Candidatus Puniceispirillum sp.]|nr:hypothetical protein [Candidatus Puniceispirillum sp.]
MEHKTIAILGAGNVGSTLGAAWAPLGHTIIYGVRDPGHERHNNAAQTARGARIVSIPDAARQADLIVLAVSWESVPKVLQECGGLDGKILIDVTNPLSFENDTIALTKGFNTSGGEDVQRLVPKAHVFKTLNQVSFTVMGQTSGYPTKPVMFVAGNSAPHKSQVLSLVSQLGFDARDAGPIESCRFLEPYAMLALEQYVKHGADSSHAFTFTKRQQEEEIVEYIAYQLTQHTPDAFLASYTTACQFLDSAPQCLGYELTQCADDANRFILRICWQSAPAHLEGFRKGPHFPPFLAAIKEYTPEITQMCHYLPTPLVRVK